MPKLTHPAIKSFSHDGQNYEADEAGLIDFPDHALGAAFMHGFKHPTTQDKKQADALAQIEPLEKANADLGQQLTDALEKIAALEKTNSELVQQAVDVEASAVELRKLVATTEAAKADLERELAAAQAELAKTKKVKA